MHDYTMRGNNVIMGIFIVPIALSTQLMLASVSCLLSRVMTFLNALGDSMQLNRNR